VSTTRRDLLDALRASLSDEDRDLLVLRVEQGLSWNEVATAFLDDEHPDPEVVKREAARLRQRYRSIRVSVTEAVSKQKPPIHERRMP